VSTVRGVAARDRLADEPDADRGAFSATRRCAGIPQ
jgi:hypothetical protein